MKLSAYQNIENNPLMFKQSDCLYGGPDKDRCSASLSLMAIGANTRQTYCSNENYDNCPIFLSKILRRR